MASRASRSRSRSPSRSTTQCEGQYHWDPPPASRASATQCEGQQREDQSALLLSNEIHRLILSRTTSRVLGQAQRVCCAWRRTIDDFLWKAICLRQTPCAAKLAGQSWASLCKALDFQLSRTGVVLAQDGDDDPYLHYEDCATQYWDHVERITEETRDWVLVVWAGDGSVTSWERKEEVDSYPNGTAALDQWYKDWMAKMYPGKSPCQD